MALSANSPVVDGRESGWKSYRVEVWKEVDPARCGLLAFAFEPGFEEDAYRRYAEWALDVPMIFLRRDGRYLDTGGLTFRRFLAEGLDGAAGHARRLGGPPLHPLPRGAGEGRSGGAGRRRLRRRP